jgi:ABC-type branched-subunit amino acid transport system substrate-binding protein
MSGAGAGRLVFRVSPTGGVLGRSAISFVAEELAPMLHRDAAALRFAVANVNDAYGRSVARGAVDELRRLGLHVVGTFPYDAYHLDAARLVRRMRATSPDVVFVSAYLQDGVAIRRETVKQGLDLVASIGTSSSYCLPMFGERLGTDALGLFASDKPDAGLLKAEGLTPSARELLTRASQAYEQQHDEEMEAPTLSGFAAAWALFHDVLPRADNLEAGAVGAAARSVRIPEGGLPNGSGLSFGAAGTADAGANLRAASVIWEWVRVGERAVVWPPRFATSEIRPIDIAP